ncbi:MAG: DUF559 domain-containing protein [Paenibacillaceae bacterium]
MTFEKAHDAFFQHHLANRIGERRGRLERGHQHGEKLFLRNVWYPEHGNLDHLHPEYEVLDWRGRSYFADFVWLMGLAKLLIEIKGYAAHIKEMDRHRYCNELNRETFLHGMGFHVISFAYDDVEQRPELCISLLRMVLSRFHSNKAPVSRILLAEKEIIRLTIERIRPIRPKDVEEHFKISHKTAVLLQALCVKGWLTPALRGNEKRVVAYELSHGVLDYFD